MKIYIQRIFIIMLIIFGITIPHIAYAARCDSINIQGYWKSINTKTTIKIHIMRGGDIDCSTCTEDMDTPIAWELERDNRWRYANYYNLSFYGTKSGKYDTLCEISPNGKIMTVFLNRLRVNFISDNPVSKSSPVDKPVLIPKPQGASCIERGNALYTDCKVNRCGGQLGKCSKECGEMVSRQLKKQYNCIY